MIKTYNIAVIGAGMWGANHIETFQKSGRANVLWVCDASAQSLQSAVERFSVPNAAVDYRAALKDNRVDAVVVASPPFTHAKIGVDVLRAGKHLLLEKPMTVNRAGLKRVMAEAARHPHQVMLEGSARHARIQPKFGFVKDFIQSGKLGRVYHIHHNQLGRGTFIEYNPKAAWAHNKKLAGGGPVVDWGVYDLSFHLGVLGDTPNLRSVKSFKINGLRDLSALVRVSDVEQHSAAYMEFDDGLTYYYERGAGVNFEVRNETRIYGTKGGLRLSYPSWDSNQIEFFSLDANGQPAQETLTVDMSGYSGNDNSAFVAHFLDCLDGSSQPAMPLERAAKHLDILFSILK
jgi:predicted dehydrogenase